MSQRASKDSHNDKTFSSMTLIGGREAKPGVPLRFQSPDLWVKGGSIIEKTLCVLGNICVDGLSLGNICGDVYTDKIIAKELQHPISFVGDLVIDPDFSLVGDIHSNCISSVTGNAEPIKIKNELDLCENDINNIGNINQASFNNNLNGNVGDVMTFNGSEWSPMILGGLTSTTFSSSSINVNLFAPGVMPLNVTQTHQFTSINIGLQKFVTITTQAATTTDGNVDVGVDVPYTTVDGMNSPLAVVPVDMRPPTDLSLLGIVSVRVEAGDVNHSLLTIPTTGILSVAPQKGTGYLASVIASEFVQPYGWSYSYFLV